MTKQVPISLRHGLVAMTLLAVVASACAAEPPATAESKPSAKPTSAAPTLVIPVGRVDFGRDLAAGAYSVEAPFPVNLTFEVPHQVALWAYTYAGSQVNVNTGAGEISFEIIEQVHRDPCADGRDDPRLGPSVDDLVRALAILEGYGFEVSPVTDTMVAGFHGKQLTMTAPAALPAGCDGFQTWRTSTRQNGVGPGEVADVRVVNVDGVRLLINIAHRPTLSDADRADLEAIVDSIQINS